MASQILSNCEYVEITTFEPLQDLKRILKSLLRFKKKTVLPLGPNAAQMPLSERDQGKNTK